MIADDVAASPSTPVMGVGHPSCSNTPHDSLYTSLGKYCVVVLECTLFITCTACTRLYKAQPEEDRLYSHK